MIVINIGEIHFQTVLMGNEEKENDGRKEARAKYKNKTSWMNCVYNNNGKYLLLEATPFHSFLPSLVATNFRNLLCIFSFYVDVMHSIDVVHTHTHIMHAGEKNFTQSKNRHALFFILHICNVLPLVWFVFYLQLCWFLCVHYMYIVQFARLA